MRAKIAILTLAAEATSLTNGLQRALGRGNAGVLTRVDCKRRAKRAREGLEAAFGDMVGVGPPEVVDVEGQAGVDGDGPEKFAHQLGVKRAYLVGGEGEIEDEERPAQRRGRSRSAPRPSGRGSGHSG